MPPQPPQQPQYIAEQQPMNSQTGLPPIQFQPSKQNYQQGDYPISRPPPGHFSHKPPRMWGGGGLFHASKQLYLNPVEATAGLIEDPQAPNSIWIVFFAAIASAFVQYYSYLKINITETVGGDTEFINYYTSSEGIQTIALSGAIAGFISLFVSWYVLSWLLGYMVKGGLSPDEFVVSQPSKSMRKLTGFLYIPILFQHLADILLIQFEDDRDVKLEKNSFGGTSSPSVVFQTEFSDQYLLLIFIIAIVMSSIVSFTLYRSLKLGLNHNGSAPAVIAVLLMIFTLFRYAP
jgi:hypothetical protein